MKIVQISAITKINKTDTVYGLGDDQSIYWWNGTGWRLADGSE